MKRKPVRKARKKPVKRTKLGQGLLRGLKEAVRAEKKNLAPKRGSFMDRLPKNHGEWLELVIKLTDRGGKDLAEQGVRLRKELEDWKLTQAR